MTKLFGGAIALVLGALLLGALTFTGAQASPLSIFTGPAGTNPLDFPIIQRDINTMVNSLNLAISPGTTAGTTGALFSASTFQLGGTTSTGSLTMGTVFPALLNSPNQNPNGNGLKSTTVKWWLTIVDSQGLQGFIPVWQ